MEAAAPCSSPTDASCSSLPPPPPPPPCDVWGALGPCGVATSAGDLWNGNLPYLAGGRAAATACLLALWVAGRHTSSLPGAGWQQRDQRSRRPPASLQTPLAGMSGSPSGTWTVVGPAGTAGMWDMLDPVLPGLTQSAGGGGGGGGGGSRAQQGADRLQQQRAVLHCVSPTPLQCCPLYKPSGKAGRRPRAALGRGHLRNAPLLKPWSRPA